MPPAWPPVDSSSGLKGAGHSLPRLLWSVSVVLRLEARHGCVKDCVHDRATCIKPCPPPTSAKMSHRCSADHDRCNLIVESWSHVSTVNFDERRKIRSRALSFAIAVFTPKLDLSLHAFHHRLSAQDEAGPMSIEPVMLSTSMTSLKGKYGRVTVPGTSGWG